MSAYLDEAYFQWLYAQVSPVRNSNPSRSYWNLLGIIHEKDFYWWVPNDDNRAEDGRDLRHEFLEQAGVKTVDGLWFTNPCSMLELFIGLSRRLSFETDRPADEWFWELLDNLALRQYNDAVHIPQIKVEETLDRVIWRTYHPDGSGGLFPLRRADKDQRGVELWYQISDYLYERSYV